jgi:Transposase DDE domain
MVGENRQGTPRVLQVHRLPSSDCGRATGNPEATSDRQRLRYLPTSQHSGRLRRGLARHLYEGALNRMQERLTPEAMRLCRSTVEHPFATIKYRIFGHPRLLMRGLSGARVEIGLATIAYNMKRIANVLSIVKLTKALRVVSRSRRDGINMLSTYCTY